MQCLNADLTILQTNNMRIQKLTKWWKYQVGPKYEIGDQVFSIENGWLKLPRKISAIGWNNAGEGTFFYSLTGIKNEVFVEQNLLSMAEYYANRQMLPSKRA